MIQKPIPSQGPCHEILVELFPRIQRFQKTRIVVLGCCIKIHFNWEKARERYQALGKLLNSEGAIEEVEWVILPELVEDPAVMLAALQKELGAGIDGILLFHASYTAGEIGSHLGKWLIQHPAPLLSLSFPDLPSERLEANSLCCQNFLLGILTQLKVRYQYYHGEIGVKMVPSIIAFARAVFAQRNFKHAKVLHAGGSRVTAFYDGEVDELQVMRTFGLQFDRVDLETVYQNAKKFSEKQLASLLKAYTSHPRCKRVDLPEGQIYQTFRFGLSILDLAQERGYVGATVKSWPDLFDCYGCAIDGAVSMLNDFGFCTAEEGEMNGLLSSLSLQFLSHGEAVPTMMDLSEWNTEKNRLGIWHCGASPLRWLREGSFFEMRKHSILENGNPETAVGLMLEFLLEQGEVTVTRYQSPRAMSSFSFEGAFDETPMPFRGNYGGMIPAHGVQVSEIMNTILSRGLDHHWSVGRGHWKKEIELLNFWLGIENQQLCRGELVCEGHS